MTNVNNQNDMYEMIKMAVVEAMREESVSLYLNSQPYVSDEEMKEIENELPPTTNGNDNYKDITNWF